MKTYRLTSEGKRLVRVPRSGREEILDHLYEFKTATFDELLAIDKDARRKLAEWERRGYVEVLGGKN